MSNNDVDDFSMVTSSQTATGDNKFMGQKERRKSSSAKMFLGDYLSLANNENIKKILAKHGDKTILFSDIIIKINKRNKMQERVLLLTGKRRV